MITFLAIQNTYDAVEIALSCPSGALACMSIDKIDANKLIIPQLNALLSAHNVTISDISFIAVNQGPGPFTTLRVVIAAVNGISFATGIPLIGINGLTAFLAQESDSRFPVTVVLLNAFSRDVYFGIESNTVIETGYDNISHLLEELSGKFPGKSVRFLGNGASMYETEIRATFGNQAILPEPMPQTCSVDAIARMGLAAFNKQENMSYQIQPLYLKTIVYAPAQRD